MRPSKHHCPCCAFLTLTSKGSYEVCPVCYWEDDPLQTKDASYEGGANEASLSQARQTFSEIGASSSDVLPFVRRPTLGEKPDTGGS